MTKVKELKIELKTLIDQLAIRAMKKRIKLAEKISKPIETEINKKQKAATLINQAVIILHEIKSCEEQRDDLCDIRYQLENQILKED